MGASSGCPFRQKGVNNVFLKFQKTLFTSFKFLKIFNYKKIGGKLPLQNQDKIYAKNVLYYLFYLKSAC